MLKWLRRAAYSADRNGGSKVGRIKTMFTGIGTKVFLISFLSVLCALFIIGFIAYRNIYVMIKENQVKTLQASYIQVEEYLKAYMKNIQTQLLFLANAEIYNKLSEEDYTRTLENMMTINSEEIHFFYVIENGKLLASVPYGFKYFVSPEWLAEVSEETELSGFWWSKPHDSGQGQTVTVAKSFQNPVSGQTLVVALDINVANLVRSMASKEKESSIFLYTRDGDFIATSREPKLYDEFQYLDRMKEQLRHLTISGGSEFETVSAPEGTWKVLKRENNRWEWVVFAVINESEAYPLLTIINRQITLIMVVWVIISLIISYRLASYIKNPIHRITRQMKLGAMGNLDARIELRRNDEFASIANNFNKMMSNIKELFENLKQAEKRKRYQELKTLQSQIHPHFLYNTLSSFYLLCETDRIKELGPMIHSLMGLLHYSIDKVGDIVSLEEELRQVGHYVDLMKLRFGDVFDIDIVVPEHSLFVPLPKLTLITLIENSIFYGLGLTEQRNHIIIAADMANSGGITIEVSDTGPGIDPAKLQDLLTQRSEGGGTFQGLNNLGIRNIHERIQLYFGESYGLHLENEPGQGLLVQIRLPVALGKPRDSL
ncbi:hypothetical protein DQG23_15015 [Paenibacillus contaminans]|uniref:HAMP domain-containing protein n=1 Tax=Paenibacillus contaminans TaxID=450362 RepID=A0A329MLW4_9BACL|nr:hypothetical protein DQG23_15015 [Paenibacillus contaminans]